MPITWPANTKSIIDEIRTAIGRPVTFYTVASKIDCPDCDLDPITDTSTNSFCPTCSGVGYIITLSGTDVNAHVTWGYAEFLGWKSGGVIDEGTCRVSIEYTIANQGLVDDAQYVVVDGREMEVVTTIPRGVKDINRLLVNLQERKKE